MPGVEHLLLPCPRCSDGRALSLGISGNAAVVVCNACGFVFRLLADAELVIAAWNDLPRS